MGQTGELPRQEERKQSRVEDQVGEGSRELWMWTTRGYETARERRRLFGPWGMR